VDASDSSSATLCTFDHLYCLLVGSFTLLLVGRLRQTRIAFVQTFLRSLPSVLDFVSIKMTSNPRRACYSSPFLPFRREEAHLNIIVLAVGHYLLKTTLYHTLVRLAMPGYIIHRVPRNAQAHCNFLHIARMQKVPSHQEA